MRSHSRSSGFTLIELLVAMGILGIIITAIISMSSGLLGYSRRVNLVNERLTEINDAAGYVALKARGASVFIGGTRTVTISSSGDTFVCNGLSSDGPCLAMVVPIVDRATAASDITGYEMLAYRIIPLSDWGDDPGLSLGWDGADTPLMLEYRAPVACPAPCSSPPVPPTAATANRVSLVASDLYLFDNAGNPVQPFEFSGIAESEVRISLRSRGTGRESNTMVPGDGPITLTVSRRL